MNHGSNSRRARIVTMAIGLTHGLIADRNANQAEAEYLQKWLVANREVSDNPITANLSLRA